MPKAIIPIRPADFRSPLSQDEQNALSWYVLSGCARKDALLIFARPDMVASKAKAAVEDYVKQFYARKEVKDYIEAYQETLDSVLHPVAKVEKPVGSLEERKAKAKSKALEFAMSLVDNIEQAEDPEFVLKMADKVGILDGDEDVEIVPQRFLGVRCSECAYRKFVEENCEEVPDGTEIAEEE
jgi:hypothetical protein